MPKGWADRQITIRFADEGSLQMVRVILAYESAVRGRKAGQTLAEMVMEAANVDSYPKEVRTRLHEIGEEIARRNVERFLSSGEDV